MSRSRLSAFDRFLLIFVLFVVRHPIRVLVVSLMGVAIAAGLALWRLDISTDQNKLFSSNVPFFRNYLAFAADFPENEGNYVLVQAKDAAHPPATLRWAAIADAITDRLRKQIDAVQDVDEKVPLKQLHNQGLLYESPALLRQDLNDAKRLVPLARLWGERPSGLTGLLGPTPLERFISGLGLQNPTDAEAAPLVGLIADGWHDAITRPNLPIALGTQVPDLAKLGATDPSRLGYYYTEDQEDLLHGVANPRHLLLIRVFQKQSFSSLHGLEQSIEKIRAAAQDAGKTFPEFTVNVTGRPALEADEMATTDRDSTIAEIVALSAVFIGLMLLLRSVWLAVAAELALLVGIGWTFGWATVSTMAYTGSWRGELNLLSAVFLIALIGIGMDYLIQVLTRYRSESSRHGQRVREPRVIWIGVFKYVAAPINTACLGAAGAFFVSVFTHFRGAAELGIIASGGLLLCLSTGYIILPALLTLFPGKVRAWPQTEAITEYNPKRHYHRWLILPAMWAALLLAGLPFALRTRFDPGLINMQDPHLPSVQLVNKLQLWSDVVLSKDPAVLRRVRDAVEKLPTVGSTESVLDAQDNYDWLQKHAGELNDNIKWIDPPDVEYDRIPTIRSKAAALAKKYRAAAQDAASTAADGFRSAANSLDRFVADLPDAAITAQAEIAARRLSQWQNIWVAQLKGILAQFHPGPPEPATMPPIQREHLIGRDGQLALYILPKPTMDLWSQPQLARFVKEVEPAVAAVAGAPPVTGIASDLFHSTQSIRGAFIHATVYALTLIFILVLLDLRNLPQTLLAISVLAMGLPVLVALMGLFHVSWNFANFFGLPILIGAGHEYGVFMVHRFNEACDDSRRAWRKWDVSDRALLACAYVTTTSFGFFGVIAHHRGLKSLGIVMALGTASIYLATLCMLRPLLLWNLSRRAAQEHAEESAASIESVAVG